MTRKCGPKLMVRKTKVNDIKGFLKHVQDVSAGQLKLLDHRGDWPTGVFLMLALAQSSYLQGKGMCIDCAVQNAALAGCPEVILCH